MRLSSLPQNLAVYASFVAMGFAMGIYYTHTRGTDAPIKADSAETSALERSKFRVLTSSEPSSSVPGGQNDAKSALHALVRMRAEGQYALPSDIPILRQSQLERANVIADATTGQRAEEYRHLFQQLGLDARTSEQLFDHIIAITRAKVLAGRSLEELYDARDDYDARMKRLLGDKYEDYAKFEASRPATLEMSEFASFAANNGLQLGEVDAAAIEQLIAEHRAFSQKTIANWGGPLDELDQPFSGKAYIPNKMARRQELSERAAKVLAAASQNGLSQESIAKLEGYYAEELIKYDNAIVRAFDPIGAEIDRLTAHLNRLQANSASDPKEITTVKALLEAVRNSERR